MATFAYTILYVPEVEAALSFYEQAFGFARKFITPEGDYGELITGGTTIAFASVGLISQGLPKGFELSEPGKKPFGIELGITTDEVGQLVDRAVKAGAELYEPPVQKPWGQTVAYVRDLNGFLVEICTPVSG